VKPSALSNRLEHPNVVTKIRRLIGDGFLCKAKYRGQNPRSVTHNIVVCGLVTSTLFLIPNPVPKYNTMIEGEHRLRFS
jgi:hypothetical protein